MVFQLPRYHLESKNLHLIPLIFINCYCIHLQHCLSEYHKIVTLLEHISICLWYHPQVKQPEAFFVPVNGILVSCRLFPSNSASSPDRWQMLVLNSWMKRGTVTATCLAQEFNPIIHPRPKPRGYWMKFSPFQYYLDSTTILTINTYILQHQYIYSPY